MRSIERGNRTAFLIIIAVRQGTLLFSTSIASSFALNAISLTAASNAVRSVARPFPYPLVLVGVFAAMRITSASEIHFAVSVEKTKFGSRVGTALQS